MTTKRINELAVGDRVTAVDGTVMDDVYEVTQVRTATIKGKTFPTFIILQGGRFWPTGKADVRTCVVA